MVFTSQKLAYESWLAVLKVVATINGLIFAPSCWGTITTIIEYAVYVVRTVESVDCSRADL